MKGTDKPSSNSIRSPFKWIYEERTRKIAIIILTQIALLVIAGITQRPVKYKVQIDEPAPYDIKANKDFLVEDEVSTQKNMEKAERTVPFIYDYIPHILTEKVSEIQKMTSKKDVSGEKESEILELLKSKGIEVRKSTLKYMLKKGDENFWREVRFILSAINGIYVVSDINLIKEHISSGRNIKIRVLGESGDVISERVLDKEKSEFLDVMGVKKRIINFAKKRELKFYPYSLNVALSVIAPNLFFNQGQTLAERNRILSDVKPVLYRVKKGEIIVRAGDRVTPEQWKKIKTLESLQHSSTNWRIYVGAVCISLFFLLLGFYEFPRRFSTFKLSVKDLSFLSTLLIFTLFFSKLLIYIGGAFKSRFGWDVKDASYFLLPLSFSVMLSYILRGIESAFILLVLVIVSASLFLGLSGYIVLFHFSLGVLSMYFLTSKSFRTAVVKAGVRAGLISVFIAMGIYLFSQPDFTPRILLYYNLSAIGGGIFSGILAAGVLPLVESMFGYTTEIKFLELSYKDHPLLKELALKARGSFQHSVMVSDLAEEAASAIGANASLAKVAGLYHDIGKIIKPHFYIENQDPHFNVHDELTPSMSALVIMSHVKYGVELAEKYNLPEEIIQIINEHHGTSIVQYFYDKAMRLADPSREKPELVDFRYPGPKPRSRESGIIMIVDKVEAAVRSMEMPTHAKIKTAIDEIVAKIIEDEQLSECELKCSELSIIKKVLLEKLSAIYHRRIDYPSTLKKTKREDKKVIQIGYGEGKNHN